jgi:calcineurin-like phosphoesterase family protein
MNSELIRRWNSVVKADDIVYHLGDVALCSDGDRFTALINSLKGRKMLITGNHDEHRASWYMEHGFEWATRYPIIFDSSLILSHEPIFMNSNDMRVNIHGHIHTKVMPDERHYINVSVEQTDYTPISLAGIRDRLRKYGITSESCPRPGC